MPFWKRSTPPVAAETKQTLQTESWNSCLDTIEEFLTQHTWTTGEDAPQEIFCDGCGASLTRKLKSLRK